MLPVLYKLSFDTPFTQVIGYLLALGLVVYAAWSGYRGAQGPLNAKTGEHAAPGQSAQMAEIVKSTLSGKVLDKAGKGVASVTISVFHHNTNSTVTTTTDASGAYAVPGQDTVNNADYAVYAAEAGYAFTLSASDPAGAVTKFDFNGLYRTVVRFLAVPARDVGGINFTAMAAGEKMVSLARTGQSGSFASGDDATA